MGVKACVNQSQIMEICLITSLHIHFYTIAFGLLYIWSDPSQYSFAAHLMDTFKWYILPFELLSKILPFEHLFTNPVVEILEGPIEYLLWHILSILYLLQHTDAVILTICLNFTVA